MSNVTREQITFLVKLQQIEIETSSLKSNLSSVDSRLETLDFKLADFSRTIEEQESLIKELNQKYRAFESDVQVNLSRIEKSQQKLHSVKTNKEYQSSLKEIDDLKAINSKIEDEMIEFLDRMEQAENDFKARKEEYSQLVDQTNKEKEAINQEAGQSRKKLTELDTEWNHISSTVDSELLAKFNKTKSQQANEIAIVRVKDAVCQGCNMNIPPQMYNELQRGDSLKTCPICERIIYWQDRDKRSE